MCNVKEKFKLRQFSIIKTSKQTGIISIKTRSTRPQKISSLKLIKIKKKNNIGHFLICNNQKCLPYQILGSKTVKKFKSIQTEILSKLNVT